MSRTDVIDGAIRVSKLAGRIVSADSTMTIDTQRRLLDEAASAVGKRIGRVFELLDESGFTSAGGETLGEMLARVERGDSGGVCFAYQSRNGRNWWEQGPFFARLEAADGLYVIRGLESLDYRTPMGRQMFGMQAVQDEGVYWAAKQAGEATVEGMMRRQVYNRVPYGFQRNGTFIDGVCVGKVDPERDAKALCKTDTAAVVARIFTLRDQDYGVGAIRRVLNDEGIPGPRGGRWTTTTVSDILKNPIYKGLIVYGRRHPQRRPGVKAVIREVRDPALIVVSPTLWNRVQAKREKVQRTGGYKAGVAGGVLVCGTCGRTLQVHGSGDGRRHYGCTRESVGAQPCPRPMTVKKEAADEYVDRIVSDRLAGLTVGKPVADARRLQAAREALEAAQVNLDAVDAKVPPSHPKFLEYLERYTGELTAAEAELQAAEAEADAAANLPTSAADYLSLPMLVRNQAARRLLRIRVMPPASRSRFANIADRFIAEWR